MFLKLAVGSGQSTDLCDLPKAYDIPTIQQPIENGVSCFLFLFLFDSKHPPFVSTHIQAGVNVARKVTPHRLELFGGKDGKALTAHLASR